ncbi:PD-(D/E)XK nuclease superfamily protein [Mariniflexile fucanivorans]|uniref:PD-(D/E)XK nuclease superfamily protein n=1 Tax=Mariniflexile fucanivorans TaxID=264023 RepID=A0A4R1RN10_9FLAO|nr:PD-(D/E)XK nuclease family protein [Mariniflexile fucanivorans]TCL67509.1 PD-(D/E)XK nuclease superfamily protein [Mariniflexile fucanivorans]
MSVTSQDLEKFVEECEPKLHTIKEALTAFSIFNVLGIQYREIRHSNFLGWLFDPNESHGLKDAILKSLIKNISIVIPNKQTELWALLDRRLLDTQVYRATDRSVIQTVSDPIRNQNQTLSNTCDKIVYVWGNVVGKPKRIFSEFNNLYNLNLNGDRKISPVHPLYLSEDLNPKTF